MEVLETVVLVGHLGLIEEQDNGRHSTVDIRVHFAVIRRALSLEKCQKVVKG